MSQRKYNEPSTTPRSPRQSRRKRAVSVMMNDSSDSFVSVDDLSDLEDNYMPTPDIKFNTDSLLHTTEVKKAKALIIENTDEEIQTPALIP